MAMFLFALGYAVQHSLSGSPAAFASLALFLLGATVITRRALASTR
jgi:hypothetical protein